MTENILKPLETIVEQPVQLLLTEFREFKELLYKVNPSNVYIPELTRLIILLSFASMALTLIDKGTDGTSVVTSLMAGDITTGLLTMFFMYLSGIATLCIWVARGRISDIMVRLPNTYKVVRYRLCCSCCGGGSSGSSKMFDCGCRYCHKPLFWFIVAICLLLAPLSTPILFVIYFLRQVSLYRKCEAKTDITDEETTSYRVLTEVVSQAMIAECFFESAPQALLQMYVLATQFAKIYSSQQRLRFTITIIVMVSSLLELGITVGGRWVDNLVAHPLMELKPDLLKFLLYTEAISFLLVRSTLICGTILVIRALLGSGLQATLVVIAFLLAPRIFAMILKIYYRLQDVRTGMSDYVAKLFARVIGTILFYPILQYQWILIYIECETVFLGLGCIFAYYGEYGVKAEIELFSGVKSGWGKSIIYFLAVLYIFNIALRWTRVIYLLRLSNAIPENTIFTVYKYCQSVTNTLDEWDEENCEVDVKKFKLRQLNFELSNLLHYFEVNFPQGVNESTCACSYGKSLKSLLQNEELRRRNCISKFRPAERQGKCQLGDTLLYAEMMDLILLRLHTFSVISQSESDKLKICRGHKWEVYKDVIKRLLCIWTFVREPRCPQQFLSRCPTFKFSDFDRLLDMGKCRKLFSSDRIELNSGLARCSDCE